MDLAQMALSDLEPHEAGVAVLRTVFGDRMAAGVRANLPNDQLLRALVPGLGTRSIVTRLYEEGVRGGPFPEAEHIIWRRNFREDPDDPRRVIVTVLGAHSFLIGLKDASPWHAEIDMTPAD
jgi:hypothetical protein